MFYLLPFFGGLAGSLHCIGMCGPFALALGADERRLWRSVLYNAGRVGTLVGLGALAGTFGAVVTARGPAMLASRALALVAGLFMLAIALETLGAATVLGPRLAALAQATVGRLLSGVIRSRSAAAPLAVGALNALLPCHLIYAFAAQAAATASSVDGMAVMGAFGLGTVPAMLGLGVAGRLVTPPRRTALTRVAGLLILVFAIWTMGRGLGLVPRHAQHGQQHGRHQELQQREHHAGAQ